MKTRHLLPLLLTIACAYATAQPSTSTGREEMKKLSAWIGHWKGEGSIQMGPGEPKTSSVDEKIEMRLDGMLLVVEGIGKGIDATTQKETVVHQAFGVVSYDSPSKSYKFKTYLRDGRSTDAYFNIIGENKYEWGFDIPNGGKSRYIIQLDTVKMLWNEIGEFSRDGSTWMKFFEMNLIKE